MSADPDGGEGGLIRRHEPDESVNNGPRRWPTGARARMLAPYFKPC